MKKLLLIMIIFLCPIIVNADNNFSLECDKINNISINEQVICRLSLNSSFNQNQISFKIANSEGYEIVDIRSNYDKIWNIKKNNDIITAYSNELQNELQEFGIVIIKALKSGIYDITITDIKAKNTNNESEYDLKNVTKKIKILSSDNTLKSIKINDNELTQFNPNKITYDIEIYDENSIVIEAESNNEFATINGIGEFKLPNSIEKFIFPINIISEDGISKIYTLNIKRNIFNKNNIDKTLNSIIIKNDKGSNLLINFKENVYEYNIDVDVNTKYLEIKPQKNNDNCNFIKNYGEQKLNLKFGDNIVIIKVQDEEGQVLNYVLNITKPIANKSNNNYLKNIIIKNYNLKFSKRVKYYNLTIKNSVNKLDITPILDNENAKYTIYGNDNLTSGSTIKIVITAENGEKAEYKINILVEKKSILNILIYILIFILLIIGYLFRQKIKKYVMLLIKPQQKKKKRKKGKTKKKTTKKSNNKKKTTNRSKKSVKKPVNKKKKTAKKNPMNKNK